ncbi:MAG: V-type ATP synthase subunit A [Endozoicomonadaceae bacterium]|nr:V-type ATP synthase subunit A [Endozoicomonadaceae bacterium]
MNTDLQMQATAKVVGVNGDVLTIEILNKQHHFMKNEVVYVVPSRKQNEKIAEQLMAEVLRIQENTADIQVFEDTRGIAVGDNVYQTGHLLSVELGPGILSQIYDGLQNPLENIAKKHGLFLQRGIKEHALNRQKEWSFFPAVRIGDKLRAGQAFGHVEEGKFIHQIMIPFDQQGYVTIENIHEGHFTVDAEIAEVRDEQGQLKKLTMIQNWSVRRSIAQTLLNSKNGETKRLFPCEPLITQQRIVDTFFPIARGGTACIPGPFGAGKTVLQHQLSKYSDIDIVVVVACGERAGEVVETIEEFPQLKDPGGAGKLIDRTVIICNTSSMPVAAREASIYTGLTLGEYYCQMGYNVLLLADSTSRWAQAMRETSNRMEEIPGEEGFPAYIDSSIKSLYERSGFIRNEDGKTGSLTMVGSVSPAGGNFEEPVTQSTLATVKCFLGLSYDRAYKRFFPAIDPLISWSRYLEQLKPWYDKNISAEWVDIIKELKALVSRGDDIHQMMQVTGEEGISLEDFITYQKALFFDMVYLQQDAFDDIDAACLFIRQQETIQKLIQIIRQQYIFEDKEVAKNFFMKLTSLFKNLNYAQYQSNEYDGYLEKIEAICCENMPKSRTEEIAAI